MDKSTKKRQVPPVIEKILSVDVYLTDQFVKFSEKFLPFRQLKVHYQLLEYMCHGLIWIPCWIAFIWLANSSSLYQMQINFFIGLILDVVIIAIVKATTRRRRPKKDESFTIGPDKFSFPSGHASRAFYIASFFMYNWPVHFIFVPPLMCFAVCICVSRILLRRHHLLDICVGAVLGILETLFIGLIYLSQETCRDLIYNITDEKLSGGEYHV